MSDMFGYWLHLLGDLERWIETQEQLAARNPDRSKRWKEANEVLGEARLQLSNLFYTE